MPQYLDKQTETQLKIVANVADTAATISLGSNLALSLFFKALLQHLWGMIVGIQNVLMLIHIDLLFPGNADAFLQDASIIAGMDIMQGEEITGEIFSFSNEGPLNDRWERY